ncbi:hypothetical protein GCU56_22525 [Geodermatophilus sabuli]|uniref:PepSY domain-containing protein n=1 Tax=Geodermatophilus sabuli TaxID=1564158 RepID=A0A7K3W720_9ACTN|nr:hypothetical protein [Geodermatophilus sabuli]NEK60636.1 hypothetical protein [Geodermatophilus sabuli]
MGIPPATPPPDPGLTTDLAVRVATAAVAEHPGTSAVRVEVAEPGRYTAHLVTGDGDRVVVRLDDRLTVLGWITPAR